jgi:Glycosyl hydrolase catalytic core/Secretion system C-terminal sorting domain
MKSIYLALVFLLSSLPSFSQKLLWSGNAGNQDFFDESNWKIENTNNSPAANTLYPNQPINAILVIGDTSKEIAANGIINLGSGSLILTHTNLVAEAVSGGDVIMNEDAYLTLTSITPLLGNVMINVNSGISWVRTLQLNGADLQSNHLNQIKINNQPVVYKANLRLDNYYLNGTVIRSNETNVAPLIIYDDLSLQGNNAALRTAVVHSGAGIPNNMNNRAKSFILKKGYMVTLAVSEDGTGKSKNYIASEEDLVVNELPAYLINNISFIRVLPWNWVNKKGVSSATIELNNTWNYQWNNTAASEIHREYAPMAWGAGGANDDADIELYKSKYKVTHVMAFNESDNCNDQSGQYNNLCQTDVAVGLYKNLMKTGLRLVSPNCRENAPFGWLKEFHDKANAQDVRIDVIGVHWYDWGSNPANSPNADPTAVFNRFKKYLQDVYNLYKLPIWISEFNANPNRSAATNYGFMKLALPYLESLDYVERYCWFQPSSGVANYYNTAGTELTNVGIFYKDQISNPSISEFTSSADSNLDIYYNLSSSIADEYDHPDVSVFPNPSVNTFKITSSEIIVSYKIINQQGQIVKTEDEMSTTTLEVNLSDQEEGMFYVILKGKSGFQRTKRIIIQ